MLYVVVLNKYLYGFLEGEDIVECEVVESCYEKGKVF